MSKRFLITILTLLIIAFGVGVAVLLTKGYTFSPKEKKVVGTGIVTVSSIPDGASVYIDGHLTTATNTTISQLSPKTYNLKIVKEGFISWEKNIDVKGGLVSEVKATLFPALPTTYPLTYNGVINPVLSLDGQKLAFAVPQVPDLHTRQKGGIWVWTLTSQPISFNRGAEPHQIVVSTPGLDFTKAKLRWSPDSKQLLATIQESDVPGEAAQRNFLLPADKLSSSSDLRDITPLLTITLKGWEDDLDTKESARVLAIADFKIRKVASDSASLLWSPDETKFMVGDQNVIAKSLDVSRTTKLALPTVTRNNIGKAKVYDIVTNKSYDLPEAKSYFWLPDSLHIILVQEDKIALSEFDGSNVAVIYAGKFDDSLVFPWPDSSRLVFLPIMSTPTASQPNLFGINLR